MARPLRIQYSGAIYHVMSRGDRRQDIFRQPEDRLLFLETLAGTCGKTQWQAGYLRTAADYVHLNPARAGLVAESEKLASYPWSSYPAYLATAGKRPAWLRVDRVLGEHGIAQDDRRGRREFERRLESQRQTDLAAGGELMRNGWRVGAEDFLDRLLGKWEGKMSEHHGGRERSETEMEKARRLIASELARAGWSVEQLTKERKGSAVKVAIAHRLREETTMPLKWIAGELRMGTWTHLNRLLHPRK